MDYIVNCEIADIILLFMQNDKIFIYLSCFFNSLLMQCALKQEPYVIFYPFLATNVKMGLRVF